MAEFETEQQQIADTTDYSGKRIKNLKELVVGNNEIVIKDGKITVYDASKNKPVVIDARNQKITIGTSNEIVLDAVNKRIDVGGTNVKIDGANSRMIVNDGVNDRVLIGYLSSGF